MFSRLALGFLLLTLPVGVQIQGVNAPEVQVTLWTGEKKTGEILSVREQCMLFHPKHGLSDRDVVLTKELVEVINSDRIQKVSLAGDSHPVKGLAIGAGLGCLVGYIIGRSESVSAPAQPEESYGCYHETQQEAEERQRDSNGMTGGAIGGLVGGLIGAGIGSAIKDEIVLFGQDKHDFTALKGLARFPEQEPEFLEAIR